MKTTILACTVAVAMGGLYAYQESPAWTERELIAMERASMEGWLKGVVPSPRQCPPRLGNGTEELAAG